MKTPETLLANFQFPDEANLAISNPDLRKAIYKAYKGRCFYSGQPLTEANMCVDHVVAKKLGGPDNVFNYVLCSESINIAKGHKFTPHAALGTLSIIAIHYGPKTVRLIKKLRLERERQLAIPDTPRHLDDRLDERKRKEAIRYMRLKAFDRRPKPRVWDTILVIFGDEISQKVFRVTETAIEDAVQFALWMHDVLNDLDNCHEGLQVLKSSDRLKFTIDLKSNLSERLNIRDENRFRAFLDAVLCVCHYQFKSVIDESFFSPWPRSETDDFLFTWAVRRGPDGVTHYGVQRIFSSAEWCANKYLVITLSPEEVQYIKPMSRTDLESMLRNKRKLVIRADNFEPFFQYL